MVSKMKCYATFFFLCIFIVSLVLNLAVQKYQFPNTDTNQNDLFSSLLVKQGTFRYNNELNQKYEPPIFGIRGLLNFGNGFVPSSLPGFIIILALFKFVSNKIVFLINPIFVIIGLYYFYRITDKYVFKKQFYSLATTLIYFFSGPFLYVSSIPFKDLPATSLFFTGLYYFLNALYEKRRRDFLLFGFFAGVTTWLNYPSIIFYLPIAIFYLTNIKKGGITKEDFKNLVACSTSFLVMFIPLYIYQLKLFNGFLNFNNRIFQLNHFEIYASRTSIFHFIFNIDSHKLFINFYNQIFLISPPLIFISILSLLCIIVNYAKEKRIHNILITFFATVLIQFLLYLSKDWSGSTFEGSVGTSYTRYLLISWGLLSILTIYGLKKIITNNIVVVILIIIFVLSGLTKGLNSDMALAYFIGTSKWANTLKEVIVLKTPENSIFFTSIYDKYIYPVRQTAVYVAIQKEERLYKTVRLIKTLLDDSFPVYIVDEKDESAISLVKDGWFFLENDLNIKYAFGNIYKIEKNN